MNIPMWALVLIKLFKKNCYYYNNNIVIFITLWNLFRLSSP